MPASLFDDPLVITEEDHAAAHLIHRLLRAQKEGMPPLELQGDALLRNAVKNPEEVTAAVHMFKRHHATGTEGSTLPFNIAAFFLPLAVATSRLEKHDVAEWERLNGPLPSCMQPSTVLQAFDHLGATMFPGDDGLGGVSMPAAVATAMKRVRDDVVHEMALIDV